MPLNINIFLEKFVKYVIASLIDFFSGYDHVKLDPNIQKYNYFYNTARPSQANDYITKNNEFDNAIRSDCYEDSEKVYPARLLAFHK
jgi:hypothetical protein